MGGRGFSIVIGTTVGTVKMSEVKACPGPHPGPQMLAKESQSILGTRTAPGRLGEQGRPPVFANRRQRRG